LQPLPVQGTFYCWGVDLAKLVDPINVSGNRYVMVRIEQFTKMIDFNPTPDKSTTAKAQVFL